MQSKRRSICSRVRPGAAPRSVLTRPVYYKGEVVGTVKKYSDRLLIVLLKAHRPAKYRENFSMTHSGKIDHGQPEPFKIEIVQAPERDKEPPTGAAVDAGSQDQGDVKPASDA